MLYTGASFWNTITPGAMFADLDTIIARYPIWPSKILAITDKRLQGELLEQWMTTSPKPPVQATEWAGWILARPQRPPALTGLGEWRGWQFSAQFNCAGRTYGASSRDLDLNIVHEDAWARWTGAAGQRIVNPVRTEMPLTPKVGPNAILMANQFLRHDAALTSTDNRFTFIHQPGCNVVLYDRHRPRWSSHTAGANTDLLFMQADGNLVLMDDSGQRVWNTKTHRHPESHLELRDDGRAAIVGRDGRDLWVI